MQTTEFRIEDIHAQVAAETQARQVLVEELACLTAHINAATARWLELALQFRRRGGAAGDDFGRWLAWRCGISTREAREYLRVADALEELPLTSEAFRRGELSFSKLRALTRVATAASEQSLLALAVALTATQLERALQAFRRIRAAQAADSHKLEYVDYHWAEDGALVLRARLASEDGSRLLQALEQARQQVKAQHKAHPTTSAFESRRPLDVEALVLVAENALGGSDDGEGSQPARLVVHIDAAALTTDASGQCQLEHGPAISPETARRLGCDGEHVTRIEAEGIPLSVGRRRRTVPPAMRRLVEARDHSACRWPGCDQQRYLAAHHRTHWAHGGETRLDNLVLLCWHHHRLVHEGGYTIEDGNDGQLRFRNRSGILHPTIPRSFPGDPEDLIAKNVEAGLTITHATNRNGDGAPMDLEQTICALAHAFRHY
jgi:hypothetical protein